VRWQAEFTGRELGAIGVTHRIEIKVEEETEEAARMLLYKCYEHISSLVLTALERHLCSDDGCAEVFYGDPPVTLHQIHKLASRIDPGEEVPSGECDCGALTYLKAAK